MSMEALVAPAPDHHVATLRSSLETVLGVPFTEGNQVDLLVNGREIFPAMLDAIERAEHTVDLLTYVYWTGDIAQRFAHTLADRARAGARVRVLLDGFGAAKMPDELLDIMRDGGCDVRWFRKPLWQLWGLTHRTHRKILVCDGRIGFTGGVGIAEEWEGDARNPDEWRDNHFRIRGPAVRGLTGAFLDNWFEAASEEATHHEPIAEATARGSAAVQVIKSSGRDLRSDAGTLLRHLVGLSEHRLRIGTGYFVPGTAERRLLADAARRGVQVDIIMPGPHIDYRVSQLAGEAEYQPLLDAGVKLWRYQPTMFHAKLVIVDDVVACIGSTNFNQRSIDKDEELSLIIDDAGLVNRLVTNFEKDLEQCKRPLPGEWRRRSLWKRVLALVARPFHSQS